MNEAGDPRSGLSGGDFVLFGQHRATPPGAFHSAGARLAGHPHRVALRICGRLKDLGAVHRQYLGDTKGGKGAPWVNKVGLSWSWS